MEWIIIKIQINQKKADKQGKGNKEETNGKQYLGKKKFQKMPILEKIWNKWHFPQLKAK